MKPKHRSPTQQGRTDPSADLALVRAARAGDREPVDHFVERMRCIPRLLAIINRRGGHRLEQSELADLAQEVFASVWRRLPDYRGEGSLESWVYSFARLSWLNAVRRKQRQPRPLGDSAEQLHAPPAAASLEADDRARLLDELGRLPEPDGSYLRWKQIDGWTFEEIARRESLSSNTVKSRYYRALDRLRQRLHGSFGESHEALHKESQDP